jgi:bifunctional enzyme CysN/CysC
MNKNNQSGLIWITGYSSSGKTTISRILSSKLKEDGFKVIFLDGDDLRGIFGNKWGYDKESRIELAQTYFRLCNHLTAQGYLVVISAIAMFDEVSQWVNINIENSTQIYLNVPPELRLERDSKTKGIFSKTELNDDYYDYPKNADLIIDNYGKQSPESSVNKILEAFYAKKDFSVDKGRDNHWKSYYSESNVPEFPSPFAISVNEILEPRKTILEIGCGNGRDAFYFSNDGHTVTAIDRSEAAIQSCKEKNKEDAIDFNSGTIIDFQNEFTEKFDVIYSRFVIHAMPLEEEIDLLNASYNFLKSDGKLFIECRSIKDNLAREGDFLSHTERVSGHYRRFIILDDFKVRLEEAGYFIESVIESNGLATFGDNDPVVIRVCARKNHDLVI